MELTRRQEQFVCHYLVDLNATQAAIRAGYSTKTARQMGARLLTNADIAEAVEKAMQERAERTKITQDEVMRELARIGFSDMSKFARWGPRGVTLVHNNHLPEGVSRVVQEVSQSKQGLKFKLHDKVTALRLLGQHLGMWDKIPDSGIPIRIVTNVPHPLKRTNDPG